MQQPPAVFEQSVDDFPAARLEVVACHFREVELPKGLYLAGQQVHGLSRYVLHSICRSHHYVYNFRRCTRFFESLSDDWFGTDGRRMISTEQCACNATCSDTLPMVQRSNPRRP